KTLYNNPQTVPDNQLLLAKGLLDIYGQKRTATRSGDFLMADCKLTARPKNSGEYCKKKREVGKVKSSSQAMRCSGGLCLKRKFLKRERRTTYCACEPGETLCVECYVLHRISKM
ncbi:hypothetical protein SARC_02767, partial [Sphaeroforma arctica JP610]